MNEKKYLIIRFNKVLSNDEKILLYDALKEALGRVNVDKIDECDVLTYENIDINIFDLISMINSDLYLDIKAFESPLLDDDNQEYVKWAVTSLNADASIDYYFNEKDFLKRQISNPHKNIKKVILKAFCNDIEYINILKVFFECNLNTSKAAELLYMHRNTLINKLDRFYDLTGYDVRRFADAIIIYSLL